MNPFMAVEMDFTPEKLGRRAPLKSHPTTVPSFFSASERISLAATWTTPVNPSGTNDPKAPRIATVPSRLRIT